MSETLGAPADRAALRFRYAAIAYAVYGIVYMVGGVLELTPERRVTFWGFMPWWAFYVAGALILFTLPIFVWQGVRWLALTLCFFTAFKALWMVGIQGRRLATGDPTDLFDWVFSTVAAIAAGLLLNAGLNRAPRPPPDATTT